MSARKTASKKYVYGFGPGKADGRADMKELLGGKGANLAEMCNLGMPVPAGFTLSTEVCTWFNAHAGKFPPELSDQMDKALARVERGMASRYGDADDPLLVSVRSGARQSMPGMMETVLNVGLNDQTIKGLIARTGNERFAWDAYRRLLTMYADVVMEKGQGREVSEGQGIRVQLERALARLKKGAGVALDTELDAAQLKGLCDEYKGIIKDVLGRPFPQSPSEQLDRAIAAVFISWNGKRARSYRRIEHIPDSWGTAVNVQSMVFGNMGDDSATGVAFTRNPSTGENQFYGEWLPNAQGEDVVAGIRTPNPLNAYSVTGDGTGLPTLELAMPKLYRELDQARKQLERHYRDMQDVEFTIQSGTLWILQTRRAKRTGQAALRTSVDMARERLITREEAVRRVLPAQLDELLHPHIDPVLEARHTPLAQGLPAGPGAACGRLVLTADAAEEWASRGEKVILVREETSPEDVHGMHAAQAILTAKGGMTSHAALVARGWGKCCVVGCGALNINLESSSIRIGSTTLREGDWLTLNGSRGLVFAGQLELEPADPEADPSYQTLMTWADAIRRLGVRTNADSPEDAARARRFGAEGIGLCRTEHMFFDPERIKGVRELIVAETTEARRLAIMKLLPYQQADFRGILKAMDGLPVTVRLLDPPLHEFVPHEDEKIAELARDLKITETRLRERLAQISEANPMLGHRGCRLGITYPEIAEMQARALFGAVAELVKEGVKVHTEIMIPLPGTEAEFKHQKAVVDTVAAEIQKATGVRFKYLVGANMETPRACLVAADMANSAEFFSFGTNDLTQTTFGYSRDDAGAFLPEYMAKGILESDPFQTLDQRGVGEMVSIAVERGRSRRPKLLIGVCGEHGGEPASIDFFHRVGLDYVSCSPFRVPIARLAAAQAALAHPAKAARASKPAAKGKKKKKTVGRAAPVAKGARARKAQAPAGKVSKAGKAAAKATRGRRSQGR